jgi:hypothetical protein
MNDYVFGMALDATRTATSDTLYVLDGANETLFTLRAPADAVAFTDATVRKIPTLNTLIATTNEKVSGDHGLLVFDLNMQSVQVLYLPAGFTSVAELDDNGTVCCLATRKIVARALKTGGSNLVVYNLANNDFTVIENPQGVTSVGPLPRQAQTGGGGGGPGGGGGGGGAPGTPGTPGAPGTPGTPGTPGGVPPGAGAIPTLTGSLSLVNPRANTVSAIAYGGPQGTRQVGAIIVRIP